MRKGGRLRWRVLGASGLAILLGSGATCAGQELAYNSQAEFDTDGNIYVSSDAGKLIWMGNTNRCAGASVAGDRQTVLCLAMQSPEVGTTQPQLRLEIYLKGGRKVAIEPGGPILEQHFWNNGRQVALFFGEEPRKGTHVLYDTATAGVIEKVAEPAEESQLPQWAKDAGQIQDETVPENEALKEERAKWLAKMLRQIGKIQPGMSRKDVLKLFTTEGGISNRLQRTYVLAECPVIKVDVKFKAANDETDRLKQDPEDVIESISRPYLGWGIID